MKLGLGGAPGKGDVGGSTGGDQTGWCGDAEDELTLRRPRGANLTPKKQKVRTRALWKTR